MKLACLAQLINVIAPIMTNADGLFRQTIFYPYSWALQFARGAALNRSGGVLDLRRQRIRPSTALDVAGSHNSADGSVALFILNRDLQKSHDVELVWEDQPPTRVLDHFPAHRRRSQGGE